MTDTITHFDDHGAPIANWPQYQRDYTKYLLHPSDAAYVESWHTARGDVKAEDGTWHEPDTGNLVDEAAWTDPAALTPAPAPDEAAADPEPAPSPAPDLVHLDTHLAVPLADVDRIHVLLDTIEESLGLHWAAQHIRTLLGR